MRFRLLQARDPDDIVRGEERAAFAARLGLPVEQVIPFDVLSQPPELDAICDGVDAVLVGGSGAYSIFHDEPWIPGFIDVLGALADSGFPTFASCFGFQGIVLALGGTVERDESRAEVGTFEIALSDEAADDPLFGHLPARFTAQLGHKDHAIRWPSGLRNLAVSDRCPYQALRVGDRHVYATQFHPELTRDDNLQRFLRYRTYYEQVFGHDEFERMVEGFQPSPHASGLLARFRQLLEDRDVTHDEDGADDEADTTA